MYLKKALWGEGLNSDESQSSTAVGELVSSLNNQRLYREVTLALRTGLLDARAEFSFLRVRGLRNILKFLRSVAESDSTIRLFCHSQSVPELQVVPVLFQNSLRQLKDESVPNLNHIFSVEPRKITSTSTDTEVALALRVLEGCCLLHHESTIFAHRHKAIKVVMDILSTRGVLERGACLDAFISIMLDSSANQMDFEACHGIEKITELIKDKQVDENIRFISFILILGFGFMLDASLVVKTLRSEVLIFVVVLQMTASSIKSNFFFLRADKIDFYVLGALVLFLLQLVPMHTLFISAAYPIWQYTKIYIKI